MSAAIDSRLGETRVSSDHANDIILAFGNSNSGKSDVLGRIRLGAQPISQDSTVSDKDSRGIRELRLRLDRVVYRILDTGDDGTVKELAPSRIKGVTAILFVTNLAGYDQPLPSDTSRTQLEADLELFDTVTNAPQFKTTPIILFFNNGDEFKRKLESVPMWKVFPDYMEPGFEGDAIGYLAAKFSNLRPERRREMYTLVGSGNGNKDFNFLVSVVKDIMDQRSPRVPEE
ncbi:Guanine nucleotide-binding protein G(o) subunit alpha [Trapelia coarctata]|nr:Guanine nucleotide-binding protein G(o) subunit alpha [Trapelia coarctata]